MAIPSGVTLTIKPGAVIKFKDGTGISNSGTIIANGEPGNMIVFTRADHSQGQMSGFVGGDYSYCVFESLTRSTTSQRLLSSASITNCIIKLNAFTNILESSYANKCTIIDNVTTSGTSYWVSTQLSYNNICSNTSSSGSYQSPGLNYNDLTRGSNMNNVVNNKHDNGNLVNFISDEDLPVVTDVPNYWGSNNEDIIRKGIWDMNTGHGYLHYDLSTRLSRPSAEAHGIVWKVVVNGYDAQDEFELLPPLGVGKHKFEVYFNRPMNKEIAPMLAMGVRSPYTSHTIAEEGSWNEEGTIYTAYLTIDGKTGADGLNRIYVAIEAFSNL